MRKKQIRFVAYLFVLGVVVGGGYLVSGARANGARVDGIPSAAPVMTYSGVLTDTAGTPLTGTKNLQLIVWDSATLGNNRCLVGPTAVTLVAGGFQLPLDSCVPAIQSYPDLWVELLVAGESLGRSKLGAVPYALESGRAQSAGGDLANRLTALETNRVVGQDSSGKSVRYCRGTTPIGSSAWRVYGANIAINVDISSCAFTSKPIIVSSLAGKTDHWIAMGGSNPYPPTTGTAATAFDIYVNTAGGITPAVANSSEWHIEWIAAGY